MKLLLASAGIKNKSNVKVVDGAVEVISEGHWRLFMPPSDRT